MKLDVTSILNKLKPTQSQKETTTSSFELVKQEKIKQNRIKTISYIAILAIIGITILVNILNYKSQKENPLPTINEENIEVNNINLAEGTYEVSTSPAKTVNGQEFTNVEISDYETVWPKEKADAIIGNNNQIQTKLFVLTFTNKERFFLNFLTPKEIQIVRMSIAGDHEFTKEEIDAYKSLAAYYFTYQKAKRLNRVDKENYNISIEGITNINDVIESIKQKFSKTPSPEEAETKKTEITQQMDTMKNDLNQGVNINDHVSISY